MDPRSHRRQVLLFFIAVILPSIVLVVLSLRMISQENELSEKRRAEQRQRLASELGQQLLVRLERVKLEVMRVQAMEPGSLPHSIIQPAVAAVGWVEANRLALPWDVDASSRVLDGSAAFHRKIRQGEDAEFVRKRFGEAAGVYQEAMEAARHPTQRAYAGSYWREPE